MNGALRWTVPADHPVFAGHFPGRPMVPGAVLLDMALHVVADATGNELQVCEISSVKFLSPAKPGDVLEFRHDYPGGSTVHFDIVAGARKIASGNIVLRSDA